MLGRGHIFKKTFFAKCVSTVIFGHVYSSSLVCRRSYVHGFSFLLKSFQDVAKLFELYYIINGSASVLGKVGLERAEESGMIAD